MDKVGWLVNDCLTCIPGTRTFWHDLMDWFPKLQDKTGGYTDYSVLADTIESIPEKPAYIIRNGTYFRKLNIDVPTFCLIQDTRNNPQQTDDFDFFKPIEERHPEVLPNSVLFIGDSSIEKKGFHRVQAIIDAMPDFNFCLVMKDDTTLDAITPESRHRVRIFNKVDRNTVRLLINSCVVAICTSGNEEGHFAGIEIGACNVPMVTRLMGCYLDRQNDMRWGEFAWTDEEFPKMIRHVAKNRDLYSPRKYYSKEYTLERCREKWTALINEFVK